MQQQVQQMPSFQDLVGLARAIPTDSPTSNDDWQQLSNSKPALSLSLSLTNAACSRASSGVPDRMSWEDILAGVANEGQTVIIIYSMPPRHQRLSHDWQRC